MILFPFYALFQILIIIWFGIYRYFTTVIKTKNVGKIRMLYNPNNVSIFNFPQLKETVKNYLTIAIIIFAISVTNIGIFQKFVFGKNYEVFQLARVISQSVNRKLVYIGQDVSMQSDGWGEVGRSYPQVAGASDENNQESFEE
jgi:hypothetical protein